MKKVGTPQYRLYKTYLDCKSRSKRKIKPTSKFMNEGINEDEKLIRPLLENSSILQKDGERSFRVVTECVMTLCHHLCPGIWCSRVHCESYSTSHAYYCMKTKPSACNVYKKYIEGVEKRNNMDNQKTNNI